MYRKERWPGSNCVSPTGRGAAQCSSSSAQCSAVPSPPPTFSPARTVSPESPGLPVAEQEAVRHVQVVQVQHDERDGVVPREPVQQAVGDGADDAPEDEERPGPAEEAHVAVLVAPVGAGVPGGRPEELDAEEPVLDGGEVGVRLDQHDVLHVHAVRGLGPEPEDDEAVDDGGDGEGEVVVLEPLGPEPQEEDARDGGDEDAQGDGGVVEEALLLSAG